MSPARLPRLLGIVLLVACKGGEAPRPVSNTPAFDPGPVPLLLAEGQRHFNSMCQPCHGVFGTGEGLGPPLLDTLYTAARLSDRDIQQAVALGFKQKHWTYGDMPKITRATMSQVSQITAYIHWVQDRAGIR